MLSIENFPTKTICEWWKCRTWGSEAEDDACGLSPAKAVRDVLGVARLAATLLIGTDTSKLRLEQATPAHAAWRIVKRHALADRLALLAPEAAARNNEVVAASYLCLGKVCKIFLRPAVLAIPTRAWQQGACCFKSY